MCMTFVLYSVCRETKDIISTTNSMNGWPVSRMGVSFIDIYTGATEDYYLSIKLLGRLQNIRYLNTAIRNSPNLNHSLTLN